MKKNDVNRSSRKLRCERVFATIAVCEAKNPCDNGCGDVFGVLFRKFFNKNIFRFFMPRRVFLRVIRTFRAVFRMCVYGIIRYIRRYFKKGKAFTVFSRRLVAMTPLKFLIDEI